MALGLRRRWVRLWHSSLVNITSTTPLSSASATVIFIFNRISRPMNSV